jgi:lipopolysaccharide/colanic/teichoic acid biosynthesis glycosyltransferase
LLQLWNVATGDMSLVGPRPEAPDRVRNYSEWQRQRLAMPPGLTGLAQVQGLRDEHSSDEKSRYDLQYIHNWSPLLDLSLILQTAWTLCFRTREVHSRKGRGQRGAPEIPSDTQAAPTPISLGDVDVNRAQSGAD